MEKNTSEKNTSEKKISEKKISEKKTVSSANKKMVFDKRRKLISLLCSALLIVGGIVATFFAMKKDVKNEDSTVYSYDITADSSYKVYLKENGIYDSEWLDEGGMYPKKLTDHIELLLKLNFSGQGQVSAVVGGNYSVNAVLEGVYVKDNDKKAVYTKTYPLKDGELVSDESGNISLEENFNISPDEYSGYVTAIEEELGGNTEKNFYISLAGQITVIVADEEKVKDFSYNVSIPLDLANSFYSIDKPAEFKESDSVTQTKIVVVDPKPYVLILAILPILVGILLALFAVFATRLPSEDERWILTMKRLLKKYGSRLVYVEEMEERGAVCKVKDMNSLISISEELHQPILCKLNKEELPDDGRFVVQDTNTIYILHIKR